MLFYEGLKEGGLHFEVFFIIIESIIKERLEGLTLKEKYL